MKGFELGFDFDRYWDEIIEFIIIEEYPKQLDAHFVFNVVKFFYF